VIEKITHLQSGDRVRCPAGKGDDLPSPETAEHQGPLLASAELSRGRCQSTRAIKKNVALR